MSHPTRASAKIINNNARHETQYIHQERLAFVSGHPPLDEDDMKTVEPEWKPKGVNALALPIRRSARLTGKRLGDTSKSEVACRDGLNKRDRVGSQAFRVRKRKVKANNVKIVGRKTRVGIEREWNDAQVVAKDDLDAPQVLRKHLENIEDDINVIVLACLQDFKKINARLLSSSSEAMLAILHGHQAQHADHYCASLPDTHSSYPAFFEGYTSILFSIIHPDPASALQHARSAFVIFEATKPAFGPWQSLDRKDSKRNLRLRWWVLSERVRNLCETRSNLMMENPGADEFLRKTDVKSGAVRSKEQAADRCRRRVAVAEMEKDMGSQEQRMQVLQEAIWAYETFVEVTYPREWSICGVRDQGLTKKPR